MQATKETLKARILRVVIVSIVVGVLIYQFLWTNPQKDFKDALFHKDAVQIQHLVIAHPDLVNLRDITGETPLFNLVFQNNLEMIQFFLDHGADPNAENKSGETSLDRAIFFHRDKAIELLRAHNGHAGKQH